MNKNGVVRERLLSITCECGVQIPTANDVFTMSSVTEAHIKTHKTKDGCRELSEAEYSRLEDLLISKIFQVLGK